MGSYNLKLKKRLIKYFRKRRKRLVNILFIDNLKIKTDTLKETIGFEVFIRRR